jgi:hypothetical protein
MFNDFTSDLFSHLQDMLYESVCSGQRVKHVQYKQEVYLLNSVLYTVYSTMSYVLL